MPDQEFYKFFDDYLEEHLRQHPVYASQLGDHRYDDQLGDFSREARQARTAAQRQTLQRLTDQIDYESLSRSAQIDHEIFQHDL